MDFSTNHDRDGFQCEFAFRISEEVENGVNHAEFGVVVDGFIDSRDELALTIRKNALEFMKRVVVQLEKEIAG